MKLVIIEGYGKRDTIKKYLGEGYEVVATNGHIRDLPVKTFGVDLKTFEPKYQTMQDKKDVIQNLKKQAAKADEVLLATDPDREGEAIAWHIAQILELDENAKSRVVFNEISKSSVQKALENPRKIDMDLVDAQQARRVLDRIVGYKLSPIICKKIQPRISAGRVQSVALKLVVDRENEITDFKPVEYWNVWADLLKQGEKQTFKGNLFTFKNKKEKPANKQEADSVLECLNTNTYKVKDIKKSKTRSKAPAPFITSTMQQDALNKLGMSIRRTSACAQALYEGVVLGKEGKVALVTYIRSDSTRVAPQAQEMAKQYITQTYGKEFVPAKPNFFAQKKKTTQDAHEAIRPISLQYTPDKVKGFLTPDQYKLYKLIFERFVASQMKEALYNNVTVDIVVGDAVLRSIGRTLEFAGYTAVYSNFSEDDAEAKSEDRKMPNLEVGEVLNKQKVTAEQKFTKPPARYTEASLIKAMEEKGIGRPATYGPTLTVLQSRKYTEKEGRYLKPTELGSKISKYLKEFFSQVINVEFTADMESSLDKIAEEELPWKKVIEKFWEFFEKLLKKADESSVTYKKEPEITDIKCEKCGNFMVKREGPYGEFLGCSNFPTCKNIVSTTPPVLDGKCPVCKKQTTVRKTKRGTDYYSCSGYPECKFMSWDKPIGKHCPECKEGHLVEKKKQTRCSKCDYKQE